MIGGFVVFSQIGRTVVMAVEGQLHGPITCGTAYDVVVIMQFVALKTARNLFSIVPPIPGKLRTVKHVKSDSLRTSAAEKKTVKRTRMPRLKLANLVDRAQQNL